MPHEALRMLGELWKISVSESSVKDLDEGGDRTDQSLKDLYVVPVVVVRVRRHISRLVSAERQSPESQELAPEDSSVGDLRGVPLPIVLQIEEYLLPCWVADQRPVEV